MRVLLLILVTTLFGCSEDSSVSEIEIVTKNFYNALMANNIKEARGLILDKENLPDDGSTTFDIQEYSLINPTSSNDTVIIKTSVLTEQGILVYDTHLSKINNEWKVDFLGTIRNMMKGAIAKGHVSGDVKVSIDIQAQ